MAKIINTADLKPSSLSDLDNHNVYCGLDSCVTLEVHGKIHHQLDDETRIIYNFELALQAPVLEMMLRGLLTDPYEVSRLLKIYEKRRERIHSIIQRYASVIWGGPLNPASPQQLIKFFYETMNVPKVYIFVKGQRKLSTNREALEKVQQYRYARPIATAVLAHRDMAKKIGVLKSGVDDDDRMRFSYNIAGTNTGRFSANKNVRGGGTNAQNITDELRRIFIADEGKKFAYLDLEQAESRFVAYVSGDQAYIEACESDDLHVSVAKDIWPDLDWSGGDNYNPAADKETAEKKFWRHWSYRDLSKRGGHLCLTEDHEVLTPEGWTALSNKPRVIMTWREDEKGVQYSSFDLVSNWTDEEFSGHLCSFEGNSISAMMTPNHRVPFKSDQKAKRGRKFPTIKVRHAIDGPGGFMPLGSGYVGGNDEEVPARLIAAFMSDGYQKTNNIIEFHLKKERKIKRLYALAKQYGYEIYTGIGDRYKIRENFCKCAGAYMLNWRREDLEDFVDEYKYWDGWIGETSVSLFSKDREHLAWIQTFGRILGTGGNLRLQSTQKGVKYWGLQQNSRLWATGSCIKFTTKECNSTRVLCPTVPSEFFYVRRNGKIFVTGNTNYLGQPTSNAKSLHVSVEVMKHFHRTYLTKFAGIKRMHTDVARELQTTSIIITPLGRKRLFFGRNYADDILRKGVAYRPQSGVGDLLNLGMWRVWKYLRGNVDLLGQLHDAILIQYDDDPATERRVIAAAINLMTIPVMVTDIRLRGAETREMTIPVDVSVGWNWAKVDKRDAKKNPDGLLSYKGEEKRKRLVSPRTELLKRVM